MTTPYTPPALLEGADRVLVGLRNQRQNLPQLIGALQHLRNADLMLDADGIDVLDRIRGELDTTAMAAAQTAAIIADHIGKRKDS